MKLSTIEKFCSKFVIFFSIVVLSMLLLQIPALKELFSPSSLKGKTGMILWSFVWILIFLECSIVPGPYIPIVIFCTQTPMIQTPWLLYLITTSAVFAGRVVAYFVGKKFGKIMYEKDLKEWESKFNSPVGKWIYAITVAAPGFPDFVLAILAGSVGINFWFYFMTNVICKGLENVLLIFVGKVIGGNFSWLYIYMILIFIAFTISVIIRNNIKDKHLLNT